MDERQTLEMAILRKKVAIYESLLHDIHMYGNVFGDDKIMNHMMAIVGQWSIAHNVNGRENRELINSLVERMNNREWVSSKLGKI